jgi:hypothetical protein
LAAGLVLAALIDYSRQTGSRAYLGDIARTFSRARYAGPSGRSLGPFTDTWSPSTRPT